eukprot:7060008-Pyramimonas_sp.AAC.1
MSTTGDDPERSRGMPFAQSGTASAWRATPKLSQRRAPREAPLPPPARDVVLWKTCSARLPSGAVAFAPADCSASGFARRRESAHVEAGRGATTV